MSHGDDAIGAVAADLDAVRAELARRAGAVARLDIDPESAKRDVARLVLTLIEFVRVLLERQAIRRIERDTLTADEIERVGLALMRMEETVREIAAVFGLGPEDLDLDLGPLGRLIGPRPPSP